MKDTKILLCKDCEGYGKIENITCTACEGHGQVIQTIETKPYKKDEKD